MLIVALFGAPIAVLLLPRWRLVVWIVMILLVFEGALRKWVLPGFQAQIFLVKDGLLLIAYTGYILYGPRQFAVSRAERTIKSIMFCCVAFYALQIFNPNSPSVVLSILGFKNYVFYLPLVFLVARSFDSYDDLLGKLRRYAWIMIPVGVLGLVQFTLPPSHWLNSYVTHDDTVTLVSQFGGAVARARTAGTFSYLSGYTTFLTVMCYMTLALVIGTGAKIRGNLPVFALLALCCAAIFTTGSRIGVLGVAAGLALMVSISVLRGHLSQIVALRSLLIVAILGAVGGYLADDAADAFLDRATRVQDTTSRFWSPIVETGTALSTAPFLGVGMASTHGGLVRTIFGTNATFHWLDGVFVEVEAARIMQETGLIGFALTFALRLYCLIYATKMALTSRVPLFVAISSGLASYFLLHMISHVVGNPTAAIYYWFGVGVLLCMQRLSNQSTIRERDDSAERSRLSVRRHRTPSRLS